LTVGVSSAIFGVMNIGIATGLPADNTPAGKQSPATRSRIRNGSRIVPLSDGRSLWCRLVKDTLQSLQVHCGGSLSETQRLMARRVSTLEAELIYLEDQFAQARAEGREPEIAALDLYGRLADRQRRLAEAALGWQPTARDVTPTLVEIAAQIDAEKRESAEKDVT
jgi:hypothetical protein